LLGKMRIYPYAQRENPPVTKHLRPEGRKWTGEQPRGMAYWESLARLINEEPPNERDRMILAMLVPLGIEKGKPFQPDARQKQILTDAANTGELHVPAPVDHVTWTQEVAHFATRDDLGTAPKVLLHTGKLSDTAASKLSAKGWKCLNVAYPL